MEDIRQELSLGKMDKILVREPSRYHIGLIIPDVEDSFFRDLIQGIEGSAPEADGVVQVFRYSGSFEQDASFYFEVCLRSGVDGVVVYIPRGANAGEFREKAVQAGVVLVTVGMDRPKDYAGGYIGSSSLQQGFEAGKVVAGTLGNNARIGVLLAATENGSSQLDPFYRGVASAVAVYGKAKISFLSRPPSGPFSGEEAAATLLEKNQGINALICSTAFDTEGAAQVVVDRNLVGKVLIVGADETESIRRYLSKGVILASIQRDSRRIGEEVIQEFRRRTNGNPPSPPREIGFRITKGKELKL